MNIGRLIRPALVFGLLVTPAAGLGVALTPAGANAAVSCPAVPAVVNGGFEVPSTGVANADLPAANAASPTPGIGWSTDDPSLVLEIWQNGFLGVPADSGAQFVEVNANAQDTIHQDVATTPGTTIRWRFAHRGRLGVDTLHVLIGPSGGTLVAQVPIGQVSPDISDGTSGWGHYSGLYKVPAGQTSTRFAFSSISETGPPSFGNFLDSISLELLPTASNDFATTSAGRAVQIPVLANDCGSGVSVHAAGPAAHGTLSVSAGGVRYTPKPGFAGTDRFVYTITDAHGNTSKAFVTVLVVAPAAPKAVPLRSSGPVGVVEIVHPSMTNGVQLTLLTATGTPVNRIVVAGEGVYSVSGITLTFTPDAGFVGTAQLVRYRVTDAFRRAAVSTYVATVVGAEATAPTGTGSTLPRTGGQAASLIAGIVGGTVLVMVGVVLMLAARPRKALRVHR